ncbi:MAG: 3,4-dihydroxy-2-butanone-4-phosphate synthase [Halieaceae bacterium]|nr:3,4-dihydroxy-2-butanone-4-phosphate synthase [Halieaceae bacterium]
MALSSVPDLIAAIRRGEMVILMDDEDRENEGDLIIAAEAVTPEIINFFASEACGLICMPITEERAQQLQLPLMVRHNRAQHETNFTVSIDAAEQRGAGISAVQRAHTVLTAIAPNAGPGDLRQPGHIFPLVAKPGGVLRRAGHTEAGVDLARLAGMEPAALIVEIMNEDGTMARRPELERFAEKHGLPMGTIADLIAYRSLHEQSVELATRKDVNTDYGEFTLHVFRDLIDDTLHHALTCGDLEAESPTLVRVQPLDLLRDVFATRIDDREGWSAGKALARIGAEGRGALVLIGQEPDRDSELEGIEAFPRSAVTSEESAASVPNYRIIGTGAQILQQLGIGRMRLMSAPLHFNALSGFHLEVTEFVDAEQANRAP